MRHAARLKRSSLLGLVNWRPARTGRQFNFQPKHFHSFEAWHSRDRRVIRALFTQHTATTVGREMDISLNLLRIVGMQYSAALTK
jgi:hypothetical protein